MDPSQPQPHDALFRATFAEPAHAAELLRSVVSDDIAAAIDWTSLTPIPASFVDEQLRNHHADLVFDATLAGRPALIYLLLEHKSADEPFTAFQLLRYVVRLWERFRREHPAAPRLPPVLPFVLHHGESVWHSPRSLRALIDVDGAPADLLSLQPDLGFVLEDLALRSEADLIGNERRPAVALSLLFLQYLRARSAQAVFAAVARWQALFEALRTGPDGRERFRSLVWYLLLATNVEQETLRTILAGSIHQEITMAETNELFELLKRKLDAEARDQGRAEGRAEGVATVLLRQLAQRFGPLPETISDRVRRAEPAELDAWIGRVLIARSLPDVFTDS